MGSATSDVPMPISYFALVLREWGTTPELRQALTADVQDLEMPVIDVGQQLHQVRTLGRLLPPGWGLKLGSLFDPATHGPVGVAVSSAAHVGDAVDVIARFGHIRTPFIRFSKHSVGRRVALRLVATEALEREEALALYDATLVGIQSLLRRALGDAVSETEIRIAQPEPPHHAMYSEYLAGKIAFGATETSMTFSAAVLARRSPLADADLHQLAIGQLHALSSAMDLEGALVSHVRQLLAGRAEEVPPLQLVAGRLGMSVRTLIRKLGQSGTSYRVLVDEHRRSRAETLLRDAQVPITEIGYRLGYADPANFGRSCRRWFGCSAGQHRGALLASTP